MTARLVETLMERKYIGKAGKKLARHKSEGGMGFRLMKAFNEALVAKQFWTILVNEHSLVAKVFKARYFPNKSVWEASKGYRPSFVWSCIMDAKWIGEEGCVWRIGNGTTVSVFKKQ